MEQIDDVCNYFTQENSQTMDTSENCEILADKIKLSSSDNCGALTPANSQTNPNDYVKHNDLKDMVDQLLSHNIMEHHLNHLDDKMCAMENALKKFGDRLERVTDKLQTIIKPVKPQLEVFPIRLMGGEAKSLGNIHDEDRNDVADKILVSKSKQFEKQRNYSAIFKKIKSQTKPEKTASLRSSISKLSMPDSQIMSQILDVLHLKKKKSPTPEVTRQVSEDGLRRAAERRQFETNMLMYRKSQFSLNLNNRINKLVKKFWESSEFLARHPSKRQVDKLSQTDDTQSD